MHAKTPSLQTRLRLVRPPAGSVYADEAPTPTPPSRARREEVARANRSASTLGVDQLREAFAARVAESLEGGRSAILRPEKRTRLVDLAGRMGIRPFDAHLLIALTQDAARQGDIATGGTQDRAEIADRERFGVAVDPAYVIAAGAVLGVALAMAAIVWTIQI